MLVINNSCILANYSGNNHIMVALSIYMSVLNDTFVLASSPRKPKQPSKYVWC